MIIWNGDALWHLPHLGEAAANFVRDRAHVVQDVIPYTCIFEDCDSSDEMYLTAEALVAHMLDKHSLPRWTCDYCAPSTILINPSAALGPRAFETATDWIDHIAKNHSDAMSANERSSLADLNKRQMMLPLNCPLCAFSVEYMDTRINDHFLLHMHEFSLLALPADAWGLCDSTTGTMSQASELSYVLEMKKSTQADLTYEEVTWSDLNRKWDECRDMVREATTTEHSWLSSVMRQLDMPRPREMKSYDMPLSITNELSATYRRHLWEILVLVKDVLGRAFIFDVDPETTNGTIQLVQEAEIVVNAINELYTSKTLLSPGKNTSLSYQQLPLSCYCLCC